MILYLLILIISNSLCLINGNDDNLCIFESSKYTKNLTVKNKQIFLIRNFKSFNELNFSACNQIIEMNIWYIIPNEKLILNDKLYFYVLPKNRRMKIKFNSNKLFIQLCNIKDLILALHIRRFVTLNLLMQLQEIITSQYLG